jgi:hypothetical protein
MGKAADNERIKLRTTFYNNIAIGLFVAGGIIPCLLAATQEIPLSSPKGGLIASGSVLALIFAFMFRVYADRIVSKIAD